MKTVLLAIGLLLLVVLAMAFRVLWVKGGKFPSSHIHDNPAMRERGISCSSHHTHPDDTANPKAKKQ